MRKTITTAETADPAETVEADRPSRDHRGPSAKQVAIATAPLLTVAAGLGYMWLYSRPRWSPPERMKVALPGDDLLLPTDRFLRLQEEIEIDAPPEKVWPIIAQLGQRKGGFYAPSYLERLCGFRIHNTFEQVDEWQQIKPGDFMFYHQAGIGSQIAEVEPGHHFTSLSDTRRPPTYQGAMALKPPFGLREFAWTWNFVLEELPDGRTRFLNRTDTTFEPFDRFVPKWLTIIALGSPSVFMVRTMLERVKRIAEGQQRTSRMNHVIRKIGVFAEGMRPQPFV